MLTWDDPNERYYEHGLDHGVLYKSGQSPVPWNGLTGFDEGGEGSTAMYYRDGVVYLADADASDFSGKMTALFFPDAFAECIGIPEVTDGLYVDNQKPKPFDLSYRSLVGSGSAGDQFGFQIHLVYNCMAAIGVRQRRTLGGDTTPTEFTFDIVATPVKLPGYRPSAHYIIDTRRMSKETIAEIEGILYGVGDAPGRLPAPQELFDLMNFGNGIVVTVHANGTWTAEAAYSRIQTRPDGTFTILDINAVHNTSAGTYVISDGGTTTVVTG